MAFAVIFLCVFWLSYLLWIEQLYIEGYLQAMLDAVFKQEYLTVRVVDNQVSKFDFLLDAVNNC